MDLQQGIRKRLIDNSTIAAAVATRVDWNKRPQGTSLPAIVLTVVNGTKVANLKDYDEVQSVLVQVDIYSKKYADSLALARAVIATLKVPVVVTDKTFGPSFVESQRESVETLGTDDVYRQSVDFSVWHKGD